MDKDLTSTNILHVDDFVEGVSKQVVDATKNAEDASRLLNRISSLAQLKFMLGDRILLLINHILKPYGHELKQKSEYESIEDLCNAFDNIVDDFGRKIDNYLQEAQGKKVIEDESSNFKEGKDSSKKNNELSGTSLFTVTKPQAFFKIKVDNSSSPFVPPIFEKPNALMSLEDSLRKSRDGELFGYCHPYQFELDNFEPSKNLLVKVVPKKPKKLEHTPLVYVDTEEQLDELISKLKNVSEIAVDLEHHSQRSYLGFTCLMQVSTRDEDFIVDTLAIRHLMYKFNVIFTDPSIVKVLHGSDFDVIWLQKDFGVYLVNTFDTGLAARTLKFPSFSYAYALQRYCGVKANKEYQLADWRVRPLPDHLVKYAREDTHYLLYIYDMMKNDLIEENNGFDGLLTVVIQNSTNLCKKRYEKPYLKENCHLDLLKNSNAVLNMRQIEVLKKLYEWRDGMAREHDESTGFILPNQKLLTIVKNMPKEIGGVIACLDQSKFGAAESIHRIITSVLSLPDSYFEGSKDAKVKPLMTCNETTAKPIKASNFLEESSFDFRGINREDFRGEDLIEKALKSMSMTEKPKKSLPKPTCIEICKEHSMSAKAFEILRKVHNPLITSWPDSYLEETGCTDVNSLMFKMKPHTVKKSDSKLPACPEIIETKPVMLLGELSTDKLLKTIRAQIKEEEEAPKRKAEGNSEEVPKKKMKVKVKVKEEEEEGDVEPSGLDLHKYDDKEWQKMFIGQPESNNKNQRKDRSNKRKADNSGAAANKKPKTQQSVQATRSFSFIPRGSNNSQSKGKPLPSTPRIPWPSKK